MSSMAEVVNFRSNQLKGSQNTTCKVYKIRWIILILFVISCASSTMQFVQYSIIADAIVKYYDVQYSAVDWTSMTYLLLYIPFSFPGSYLINKMGLRAGFLIGMTGTCIGAWVKVASVSPDRFWVIILGQSIIAISEVFMLSVPPTLAAIWFGANEVSSACSIGVFGLQFGIAIGFLLPPMLVDNQGDKAALEHDLYKMLIAIAVVNSILLLTLFVFFKAKPPFPPSEAQRQAQENKENFFNFLQALRQLFTNPSYLLLLLAYGINVGIFYAISTLLNQIILKHYSNASQDAGRIGLLILLTGMLGSVVCGVILDTYNRFKATILAVYSCCLLSMIAFTFTLSSGIVVVYLVSALLGFFMTGIFPVGYQLAAELTYPLPEATSAGILTATTQGFGIIFTYMYSFLLSDVGDKWTNLIMSAVLLLGLFCIACIRFDLRKQVLQVKNNII